MAVEYMNDDELKVFVVRALKDLVKIAMEEKQEVNEQLTYRRDGERRNESDKV